MAGLKYERFIVKMSVEQKIELITSTEFYKSSPVGSYEFPVFDIQNRPFDKCGEDVRTTHFPSDLALASSWNPALVNEVYAAIGAEARAVNSYGYFNCSGDISAQKLTDEYFVLGKFLAEKSAGLSRSEAFVNFVDAESEDEEENALMRGVRDQIIATGAPSSIIFNDVEEAEKTVKRFKYDGLSYGIASTVEEALDFLYSGSSFLFLTSDFRNGLANKLISLTNSYKIAHNKYVNDRMAESSFARLVRTFKIFDPEIIDRACDKIIDIVFRMKSDAENGQEQYKALGGNGNSRFDEINHDDLAVGAAQQSIILLKNDGTLPISRAVKLAVMGECAKELKYQRSFFTTTPTSLRTPFEAINDYELNTVGFALGYSKGERGRTDLIDHANLLCGQADCVLLYLAAEKGADSLPPEQLDLLNAIAGRGAKIIAVVEAEDNIDMSFAGKCAAVLLSFAAGQGGAVAALDIITGEISPSGKLPKPLGHISGGAFVEDYGAGYGLSYTQFEYGNLKANESGVSFTVRNVGDRDGCAVPQLFVRKKNTQSLFKDKQLKGFTKVFVAAGDAVRVKIAFDDVTFSQYTKDKGYFIEGGLYTVSVGESAAEDKLSGILMLKDYSEKNSFKNKVVDVSDDGRAIEFTDGNLSQATKDRKQLPFALKLTLAIMFAVYVDALLVLFAVTNLIAQKDFVFYVIIAAVGVAVNALAAVYIALTVHRRKTQQVIHPNELLSDMLENVGEFAEIAKVKYKLPVEEEKTAEEEEETSEEQAEEPTDEEALAATYEVKFDDTPVAEAAAVDKASFTEISRNLHDFAKTRGLNIEITSSRILTAAIASCKIVFVTSKNTELIPLLVKVLGEYYGNETPVSASDDWHSLSDLLWSKDGSGDKYVLSPFSNAVYAAYKSREQERVLVIDNVNVNNLGGYFFNFLEYANHPTEEFIISFNEDTSFRLPDNLTYLLVLRDGLDGLPTEILNASMVAELMLTATDAPAEEQVEPKVISHEDFRLMLAESKETSFVSERVWKKVDALAEAISAGEKFAIGNKNTIQMESFTSVMMFCGADEAEAVTNMFLVKLALILKNTRMYRADGGDKAVYALIEKLFPDEELIKIKRALTKPASAHSAETQPAAETETAEAQPETANAEEKKEQAQPVAQPAAQPAQQAQPKTGAPAAQPAQPAQPKAEAPATGNDPATGDIKPE